MTTWRDLPTQYQQQNQHQHQPSSVRLSVYQSVPAGGGPVYESAIKLIIFLQLG